MVLLVFKLYIFFALFSPPSLIKFTEVTHEHFHIVTTMVKTCRFKEWLQRKRNGTLLKKKPQTSQKAVKYLCKMSVALYTGTEQHNALSHTILSFMCVQTATGKVPHNVFLYNCQHISLQVVFLIPLCRDSHDRDILSPQSFLKGRRVAVQKLEKIVE